MANCVQDMSYSNRSESLSDCITLETTPPPVSRYSSLRTNLRVQPSKMAQLETKASRREDRSTCARVGGKGGLGEWPMPRSKRSREDIRAVGSVAADLRYHSRSATVPSSTQRHMLPGANLALKEVATLNKRKGSLSDLGLGPMTTVQEGCLDSPTIPGHHPLFIRSMSYPDCTPRLSEEICETTPRESEFCQANVRNPTVVESVLESSDKTVQRQSSTILRKDLTPVFIPSSTRSEQAIQANRPMPSDEQEDKPPQVPPKSPRTESRASPRPRKLPHSANGSTSTISSTTSAATSTSSLVGSVSSYPTSTPTREKRHFGHKGSVDNIKDSARAGHWASLDRIGRHTPPPAESPTSHLRNLKNEEQETPFLTLAGHKRIESSPSCQKRNDLLEDGGAVKQEVDIYPMWHQKETSQASVIDRGRPMGRGDTSLMQKLSKPLLRTPSVDGTEVEIPSGLRAKEASSHVPKEELKLLMRQADERVESFEVLSMKDVSSLSKELALLDERCEYLRNTYNSLRQGRKGLHMRMISHLKSPRMAKFSRDSILKQEEALAELDLSIDDWVLKLEHADNRRTRVRQKLLEHVAATLTIKTVESAQPQHVQTPPRSPKKTEDDYKKDHRDVQSSEFYADSGVAALLSAIEMEIGMMDDPSQGS